MFSGTFDAFEHFEDMMLSIKSFNKLEKALSNPEGKMETIFMSVLRLSNTLESLSYSCVDDLFITF